MARALYSRRRWTGPDPVYRDSLARTARSSEFTAHGAIAGWQLTPEDGTIMYSRQGGSTTRDLHRCRARVAKPESLTGFNRPRRRGRHSAALKCSGSIAADGRSDSGLDLVKPHGFRSRRLVIRLILNVHGGPQSQWKDRFRGDWQVYPGKGYVVAFPNPTGRPDSARTSSTAISCDWSAQVFDDLGRWPIPRGAAVRRRESRMGAMGWSWGGYMTMWLAGHTDRLRGAGVDDGGVRPAGPCTRRHRRAVVPVEHDLCGTPWDNPMRYDRVVALIVRRRILDADTRDHGREGLSGSLYAEPSVLHGPSAPRGAVATCRLSGAGALAQLVRNGVLLPGPAWTGFTVISAGASRPGMSILPEKPGRQIPGR
jgi:hypothetical protein